MSKYLKMCKDTLSYEGEQPSDEWYMRLAAWLEWNATWPAVELHWFPSVERWERVVGKR